MIDIHRKSLVLQRLLCTILLLLFTGGCALISNRTVWRAPAFAEPTQNRIVNSALAHAEVSYLVATKFEYQGSPSCVDLYFQSAAHTWPVLEKELSTEGKASTRALELHRSAVAKMLITAQRFDRWDPDCGLIVEDSSGKVKVQALFHDFPWDPTEFQQLLPSGNYEDPNLSHAFRCHGLGVPLVVQRHASSPQPYTQAKQSFAATALLRKSKDGACYQLDFCNPNRRDSLMVAGCQVSLARDLSAPYAFTSASRDRKWLNNFLQPGVSEKSDGLFMIEPYQSGKIPVIFLHGLLSDPITWLDLVNEVRANPDLEQRFQWWAYQYATGEPFLKSAAQLRRQLVQVRQTYDPKRLDPAFSQIVLIGHSMGGLVAKLQVTESRNSLWRAAANHPLSAVNTSDKTRRKLQESFFFRPSVDVKRVVFVATPHKGSAWARRPVGRLGSALVEPAPESEALHSQLLRDNPNLMRDELRDRLPTSIDLLEPESSLLAATAALPYSPAVRLHSIIGIGQGNCLGEDTDGVVPVTSSRLLGVASEKMVDARHARIHRDPNTVSEVVRILRLHLR